MGGRVRFSGCRAKHTQALQRTPRLENRAIRPVALSPILFYHIMLAIHLCGSLTVSPLRFGKTPVAVRHDSVTMPDYYNDRQHSGRPVCTLHRWLADSGGRMPPLERYHDRFRINRVAIFVNEIKVRHIVARQYVTFQNNFFLSTMHFKSQAVTASMIFLKEMAT